MNREKGSALLLVLLLMMVMLTITFSLTLVVGNEIKMSSYNRHRLKAIYKAEAGLEEALILINNNDEVTIEDIEKICGSIDSTNDYQISNAIINKKGDYVVTAVGKSGKVSREVKVCLSP